MKIIPTSTRLTPTRTLLPLEPFSRLNALENRLEKLFSPLLSPGDGASLESPIPTLWSPLVDITEDDKEYLITAELPELKREDVKVTLEQGELSISGSRHMEKEAHGRKYHRVERSYGSFFRNFSLPDGVEANKVEAEFHEGVLKVHLPKDESAKTKTIEVNVH